MPPVKMTEATMLQLLREKHSGPGNGGAGEWAFLPMVRNAGGFDANRTFDAVALSLWPSRGMEVHIYEVKVSRSDWRRELSKPDKAEDAFKLADRFWIAAPEGIVHDGELPPTWGLIEARVQKSDGQIKLRTKVAAPPLHERPRGSKPPPLPRGFVVSMLRSAPGAVPGGRQPSATDKELAAARAEGREEEKAIRQRLVDQAVRSGRDSLEDLKRFQDALQEAGLSKYDAELRNLTHLAPAIFAAHRGARVTDRLGRVKDQLRFALEAIEKVEEEVAGGQQDRVD